MKLLRLMSILMLLTISSCVTTPVPVFEEAELCATFITEEKLHCFCALYDVNNLTTTSKWVKSPMESCNGLHGFSEEYFYKKFEVVGKELRQWIIDEVFKGEE